MRVRAHTLVGLTAGLLIPVVPGNYLFLGSLALVPCLWILWSKGRYKWRTIVLVVLSGLPILISAINGSAFVSQGREWEDSLKIVLLLVIMISVVELGRVEWTLHALILLIYIIPAVVMGYLITANSADLWSYSGRFYLPYFGSPNSFGIVCAIGIIVIVATRRSGRKLADCAIILAYAALMIVGTSRGALIALTVSMLALSTQKSWRLVLVSVLVGSALFVVYPYAFRGDGAQLPAKFDLVSDVHTSGGSGRVEIWSRVIDTVFAAPWSFMAGGGAGRVIGFTDSGAEINHPHNFFLFVAWAYGSVAFLAFVGLWSWVGMRIVYESINGGGYNRQLNSLGIALWTLYSISFMVDCHVLAAQWIGFHGLALGLLVQIGLRKYSLNGLLAPEGKQLPLKSLFI
jgi:hypothetical protein